MDLTQVFVFPFPLDSFSLMLRSFEIGNLSGDKFKKLDSRCTKAKCDFFARYKHRIKGNLAIQRCFYEVPVVHYWSNLVQRLIGEYGIDWDKEGKNLRSHLIWTYFEQVSIAYQEDFWFQFAEEQHLLTAAGAGFIDERSLQGFQIGTFTSIFLSTKGTNWGYGVPLRRQTYAMNLLGVDKHFKDVQQLLKAQFDIDNSSEIPSIIQKFVSFIGKAKRSLLDDKVEETLLNYVIALDLVFGQEGASTEKLSDRVALVVFRKLAQDRLYERRHGQQSDFYYQSKRLKKIYDARSKYVHEGREIEFKLLDELDAICKEVLFCMLRCSNNLQNQESVEKWRERLDFLVGAEKTRENLGNSYYEKNGIWVK